SVQPSRSYVFMIFRPAFRLLTGPLPPLRLAARALAAVILPPLLFFIVSSPWAGSVTLVPTENTVLAVGVDVVVALRYAFSDDVCPHFARPDLPRFAESVAKSHNNINT